MKKYIAMAVVVLAFLVAGCIQFNPNAPVKNNTKNVTHTQNQTMNWVNDQSISSKFEDVKGYLESIGNISLSNYQVEKNTGMMRANVTLNGKPTRIYLSPNTTAFWFESSMQKLNGQTVEGWLRSILKPGVTYRLENTGKKYGLEVYNYTLSYMGRMLSLPVYKFGNNVLPGNAVQTLFSPSKTERPDVDLYIMAFCPYGRQAATLMYPVERLLGRDANISVHYVLYPKEMYGNKSDAYCVGNYCSMHGVNETREDVRQLCIEKYYPDKFWDYLDTIASNFSYSPGNIEDKWKGVAEKFGINTTKVEQCEENESTSLLSGEYKLDQEYGVSGSPTLIINGKTWNGPRMSNVFKWAICQAFKTQPSECNERVNESAQPAPAGNCG